MPLLHIGGNAWFDWPAEPEVILPLVAVQAAYLWAVIWLRPLISDAGRVRRRQVALFSSGMLALYFATASPLDHVAGTYLLSAHALELVLMTLVAAPLLLSGTPSWLLAYPLRSRAVLRVARVATKPLVTLATYNLVLLFTHLPGFYDLSLRNDEVHFVMHAAWVGSALLMWWPILSPLSQLPRPSYPVQLGYLFLQSLLPAIMASFITFSDTVVYDFYAEAPRLWGISPITDQQIAGGLMKLLGSLILWSFMVVVFFRWYAREEADTKEPRWEEVEAELTQLGLGPR